MSEVLTTVQTILLSRAGVEPDNVTLNSSLNDDVGIDSVDMVEFVLELEQAFQIDIADTDAAQLRTVGDVVELVSQLQSSPM